MSSDCSSHEGVTGRWKLSNRVADAGHVAEGSGESRVLYCCGRQIIPKSFEGIPVSVADAGFGKEWRVFRSILEGPEDVSDNFDKLESLLETVNSDEVRFIMASYFVENCMIDHSVLKWLGDKRAFGADWSKVLADAIGVGMCENPSDALNYLKEIPDGAFRRKILFLGTAAACRRDWRSQVRLLPKMSEDDRGEVVTLVVNSWAERDLESAREALLSGRDELVGPELAEAVVLQSDKKGEDILGICEMMRGVGGDPGLAGWGFALRQWIDRDAASAGEYLAGLADEGLDLVSVEFARQWAEKDPKGALKWVLEEEREQDAKEYVGAVMDQWMAGDAMEASRWLAGLPEGEIRDSGIQVLIRREVVYDPQVAFHWSELLSNESARNEALVAIQRRIEADPVPEVNTN